MEKMTKKEMFAYIAEKMAGDEKAVKFCEKEIKALDAKTAKAKERAAKRAAEGDELREAIYEVVGDEPMTLAQIVEALGIEGVTANKVSPRANALVDAGQLEKTQVADGKRRLVAFKRVSE